MRNLICYTTFPQYIKPSKKCPLPRIYKFCRLNYNFILFSLPVSICSRNRITSYSSLLTYSLLLYYGPNGDSVRTVTVDKLKPDTTNNEFLRKIRKALINLRSS